MIATLSSYVVNSNYLKVDTNLAGKHTAFIFSLLSPKMLYHGCRWGSVFLSSNSYTYLRVHTSSQSKKKGDKQQSRSKDKENVSSTNPYLPTS
jgi:hypothetical protein